MSWSVSTLVPVLHGRPRFKTFDTLADAVEYAQSRAKAGPRVLPDGTGGKVYYVLKGEDALHMRVFRGMRGRETRPGFPHDSKRREFIFVQRAHWPDTTSEKPHWLFDHGMSFELIDRELERDISKQRRR